MATPRVSNRDSHRYVQRRETFNNHNDTLWGTMFEKCQMYVVYSYRMTWPLFIAVQPIEGGPWVWFENADKFSVTTSKHRTQAHPLCPTTHLTLDEMVYLDRYGYQDFMARRLGVDIHAPEAA